MQYCQTFSSPRSAWLPVGAGEVLWWAGVLDNPGRFLLTAVEGAVAGSVLLLPPVNAVEGILFLAYAELDGISPKSKNYLASRKGRRGQRNVCVPTAHI